MPRIDPKAIAAGTALRALRENEVPREVKVEGESIPLDEASQAILEATREAEARASQDPTRIQRALERFEPRVDQAEKLIGRTRLGERALDELQASPEKVTRSFRVEVLLEGGESVKLTVAVFDIRLSKILTRAALGVDAAAFIPAIPFLGLAIRGTAMATAWTSSVLATAIGKDDVARSLEGMARKQMVLTAFRLMPVPGTSMGSGIVAALANSKHLTELRSSPTVALVVDAPAALPASVPAPVTEAP